MNQLQEEVRSIPGPCELEARLGLAGGRGGLVIAHPHPLYGGSLDNNVVLALARAGFAQGLTTLRFNFRGVGLSRGVHDNGRGERDDLKAAVDYLAEEIRPAGGGEQTVIVAGYSFGAWVAALTDFDRRLAAGPIWVAPPLAMLPLAAGEVRSNPGLILAGGRDPFCPEESLYQFAAGLGPSTKVEIRPGADHFFAGSEDWITDKAQSYLGGLVASGQI